VVSKRRRGLGVDYFAEVAAERRQTVEARRLVELLAGREAA